MREKVVSGMTLTLLLLSMLTLLFNIKKVDAMVFEGDKTYTIANGNYSFDDNIIVKDNATLIVENATLYFNTSEIEVIQSYDNANVQIISSEVRHDVASEINPKGSSKLSITNSSVDFVISFDASETKIEKSRLDIIHAYGSSDFFIDNSTIRHISAYGSSHTHIIYSLLDRIYSTDNPSVIISDTRIQSYIDAYKYSNISVKNSFVDRSYLYGSSTLNVDDSTMNSITTTGSSSLFMMNSNADWVSTGNAVILKSNVTQVQLVLYVISDVSLDGLSKGFIDYLKVLDLIIDDSQIGGWGILARSSTASISDSFIDYVIARGSSLVNLINTSVIDAQAIHSSKVYVSWFLDVLVTDITGSPVEGALVEIHFENSTLFADGDTDEKGVVEFILFEKMINSTGTFFFYNYRIKAKYDGYLNEMILDSITDNMNASIRIKGPRRRRGPPWILPY